MAPIESKPETNELKDLPENLKELKELISKVEKHIQIFEYQKREYEKNKNKKIQIEAAQKQINKYEDIKTALQILYTSIRTSKSELDLVVFAEKNNNSALIESAINYIYKQREKSEDERRSDDAWIASWINKIKQTDNAALKTQETKDFQEGESLREKILMDSINENGKATIHTSLPNEYSSDKSSGFQNLSDENWSGKPQLRIDLKNKMENEKIRECVIIEPYKISKYKKEVIKPATKGLFGIGAREEQTRTVPAGTKIASVSEIIKSSDSIEQAYRIYYLASGDSGEQYKDYSNRGGQILLMEIILPKSVADKTVQTLEKDPTFIRRLAKMKLEKHLKTLKPDMDFENVWKKGDDKTNGIPLSPPYELWDKNGRKMEIVKS